MQIRVSVGNLAIRLLNTDTNEHHFFGVLNSASYRKGHKRFGALGGAVHLTDFGRQYLEDTFEATGFEMDGEVADARFLIDDKYLAMVFDIFSVRDQDFFEIDPAREIMEELTKEKIADFGQILTEEEAGLISFQFAKMLAQAQGGNTSAREKEGVPTRRLFHLFEILVPQIVLNKMIEHPTFRLLTDEEVATTEGGAKKGITSSGEEIADNVIW